jgi:hypothetical protein
MWFKNWLPKKIVNILKKNYFLQLWFYFFRSNREINGASDSKGMKTSNEFIRRMCSYYVNNAIDSIAFKSEEFTQNA